MTDRDDASPTLADDEITTHRFGNSAVVSSDDSDDTGDVADGSEDVGDSGDTGDTGDVADTGDDS